MHLPRPKDPGLRQWRLPFSLVVIVLWWHASPVHAVPASPEPANIVQPDGRKFRLVLHGDEFFSWHETPEGFAVVRNPADGFWEFAQPEAHAAEFRAIPGARVGSTDPARLRLKPHARPNPALWRQLLQERRQANRDATVALPSPSSDLGSNSPDTPPPEPPPNPIPISGIKTVRNLVILACFSDHWDATANTVLAAKGRVAVSEYANLFNQLGHTTDGAVGSVRDYYREVSYGKLTVDSIISPWVKLPNPEAFYGAGNPDANPRQMVADAIEAAATAGFDFSQGDLDGDGWADGLTILHSGHGQEYSGNPSDSVWSHKWSLTSVVSKNGVSMYRYHTEPALRGSASSSTGIIRIGVICHEMGHFYGLPDLYDPSSTTHGLGRWSVMAGGSWNGSDGRSPAHFDAWSKCFLGLVNPVALHSQAGVSLARVEDNPAVGLIRDGVGNGEYFLVENRAKFGFDNDPAIFPGLVVYHIDSKSADNNLGSVAHPLVKIEEADGNNSLGLKTSSSQAGDVWTSTNGLAGGFRDQTGNTTTNALRYQAATYARSDDPAYYSFVRLNNFSAAGNPLRFDAATLRTSPASQTVTFRDFTIAWPACSQSTSYEVQEGIRTTLTAFSDSAEDEEATNDNWYLAGPVKRDSAGARSGTFSYSLLPGSSSVQSLTLQRPFTVGASTAISYYLLSHLSVGVGYLKAQVSTDAGNTWRTLSTDSGNLSSWTLRSFGAATLTAAGINPGDQCLLRFVANFERGSGWSGFPAFGFALDDIAITGTQIAGYSGWTTVGLNVTSPSLALSGRASGTYAYRVRNFANAAWQPYGPVGETTVNGTAYSDWTVAHGLSGPNVPMAANPSGDGLSNLLKFALNLNPTIPDARTLQPGTGTAGLPAISAIPEGGSSWLVVEFVRRRNVPQLAYTVQFSSDLVGWAATGGAPTVAPINANWERVVVRDTTTGPRRFARVRVTWTD